MPEYAVSKLTGDRSDRYFPSFSGSGNSRPQWGQITVSPGFHSFAAFVEAQEESRNRAQSGRSNSFPYRLIAESPCAVLPSRNFPVRGATCIL